MQNRQVSKYTTSDALSITIKRHIRSYPAVYRSSLRLQLPADVIRLTTTCLAHTVRINPLGAHAKQIPSANSAYTASRMAVVVCRGRCTPRFIPRASSGSLVATLLLHCRAGPATLESYLLRGTNQKLQPSSCSTVLLASIHRIIPYACTSSSTTAQHGFPHPVQCICRILGWGKGPLHSLGQYASMHVAAGQSLGLPDAPQ